MKRGVKVPGCPGGCLSAVCGLGAWCCCPALLSGLVVWPCRLVLSSGPVSFRFLKRGHDPGQRPKDRSSVRYPQVRTIYLDVGPAIGYLLLLCFFLLLFLCTPSSRFRPTGRGQWKSLHVQKFQVPLPTYCFVVQLTVLSRTRLLFSWRHYRCWAAEFWGSCVHS